MRCYKCGSVLSANDICPKCQTDVSIYKKTAMASDVYYNKALEKAWPYPSSKDDGAGEKRRL